MCTYITSYAHIHRKLHVRMCVVSPEPSDVDFMHQACLSLNTPVCIHPTWGILFRSHSTVFNCSSVTIDSMLFLYSAVPTPMLSTGPAAPRRPSVFSRAGVWSRIRCCTPQSYLGRLCQLGTFPLSSSAFVTTAVILSWEQYWPFLGTSDKVWRHQGLSQLGVYY